MKIGFLICAKKCQDFVICAEQDWNFMGFQEILGFCGVPRNVWLLLYMLRNIGLFLGAKQYWIFAMCQSILGFCRVQSKIMILTFHACVTRIFDDV